MDDQLILFYKKEITSSKLSYFSFYEITYQEQGKKNLHHKKKTGTSQ